MIYLVRHGESVANIEGLYQGQTYDTNLSDLGKEQVKQISGYFQKIVQDGAKIDDIWVSPLTRTKETALPISSSLHIPYKLEPLLLEADHGVWSGKGKDWVCDNYMGFCEIWWNTPSKAEFPEGEKFVEVVERAKELVAKLPKDKNIILVSHDNTIRAILSVAENRDIDKMWDYPLENACICVLEEKNDGYDLKEIIVEHLNGLRSDVAHQVR